MRWVRRIDGSFGNQLHNKQKLQRMGVFIHHNNNQLSISSNINVLNRINNMYKYSYHIKFKYNNNFYNKRQFFLLFSVFLVSFLLVMNVLFGLFCLWFCFVLFCFVFCFLKNRFQNHGFFLFCLFIFQKNVEC